MLQRVYESARNFSFKTIRGLQKLISYEPAISCKTIILCRSPGDYEGFVSFPKKFAEQMTRIYGNADF
ncbi:hypothetical protein J4429_05405 [Candidatus Pacearchaeota archaeon]|nr:hypothetical protein [Candidatus Pacearchaeota archaeon]